MLSTQSQLLNHTAHWRAALLVAVATLPLILTIPAANAGQYVLEKGKGVEVCEAYQKNLNSFGEPMVCERQLDPQLPDFKKPEWTKPNDDQARSLEFDMAKYTSRVLGKPEPKSEAEIGVRTEKDIGWPAKRRLARVDVDNDGKPDIVLRQENGTCPETRAFSVNIAVLTEDVKRYDLEKSQFINAEYSALVGQLKNDPKPWEQRTAGLSKTDFRGYALYDVFQYRGTTYFDLWETGKDFPDPASARLHVFLHKNGKTQEVCTYRFEP